MEIVFPYETVGRGGTRGWMEELGLNFAAVNVNIKKEPGGYREHSRPIKGIRDRAVEMMRKGKIMPRRWVHPMSVVVPLPTVMMCFSR